MSRILYVERNDILEFNKDDVTVVLHEGLWCIVLNNNQLESKYHKKILYKIIDEAFESREEW